MKTTQQIEELIGGMTLEEKIGMIHGDGIFRTKGVERLGIPPLVTSDGPMGVRMEFHNDSLMPMDNSDDYVTYNPSNSALAATWNPELAYESGKVLGEEARGRGKDVILAPGINIKRDPLCGRNFEYMSEDPCLIETMVVPFIKGVQENDVAACVKHFAVNNQETDRLAVDTLVDERTLREIYLPGFRAAVKDAGTYSLMNAYNKFDGVFCSENKVLLDDILRNEWEYDGTVISDWGSVHSTKGTAEASMDVEMSITPDFDEYFLANPLLEAVKKGEVSEADVDRKVRNILRMMFRLKMIGGAASERKQGVYNTPEHQQSTLKTAREAIVLLKNEIAEGQRILPLTRERLGLDSAQPSCKKIAVIGQNASCRHAAGGGSAEIKALYEITPLLGFRKAFGGNRSIQISYAKGYYIPEKKKTDELNWQETSLECPVEENENLDKEEQQKLQEQIRENSARLKKEACELAKQSDFVIFVGGLNHDHDVEGKDRADMRLPYGQDELIEELLRINPDTIVVMVAGSPVEMPWRDRAKAIVWCYYSGMETGNALTDILLGNANPSAKLPETFPMVYADTVTAKNGQFGLRRRVEYREGFFVGYRYYEKEGIKPAFPFGHGLSYTDFVLDNLRMEKETKGSADFSGILTEENENDTVVTIRADVTNVGDLPGAEVVQCYVADCECSVSRPVKELKAFQKVFLQAKETKTVTMKLPLSAFAFYDTQRRGFVAEAGVFKIYVGNASDHCPLEAEILL